MDSFEVEVGGKHNAEFMIPAFRKAFKNTRPAWTSVTVKGLLDPMLVVEISVEAFLP